MITQGLPLLEDEFCIRSRKESLSYVEWSVSLCRSPDMEPSRLAFAIEMRRQQKTYVSLAMVAVYAIQKNEVCGPEVNKTILGARLAEH